MEPCRKTPGSRGRTNKPGGGKRKKRERRGRMRRGIKQKERERERERERLSSCCRIHVENRKRMKREFRFILGTDRLRARSSAGRAAVPPRAVLRTEGLSRFHKCPVRRRGSRLGSMMSSWVQLLLALLATCLRFGVAEGDPLPAALVELVRNSPISSIEDLQLLLLSDSVDEEDGTSAANGGHRLPRSLDAQPAQQALCKVRTEVVEVTRGMLDRSNANFLLWPPCVEVQRCSGCCNAKSLQCVPVVTHTRYLQVMKIEYINKRPTYAKAVVSVVDHVECRCQPAPRPPVAKKKSARRQHGHQHRNQTLSQGHEQVKVHTKDELHQWDELKQNQRAHLEDLLEQHWNPRGDTFTQPGEGYSLAGEDASRSGEAILYGPHWAHNSTSLLGTKDQTENLENVEGKNGWISDGNKTVSSVDNVEVKNKLVEGGDGLLLNRTEGKVNEENRSRGDGTQTQSPLSQEDKSKFSKSHTSGFSHPVTQNPQVKFSPTEATNERVGIRFKPTKEPNPGPGEQERRRDNETPEEVRILQTEEEKLEQERKELLLLHKRLDQEKEILRQQQMKREEEERQKEKQPEHHPHATTSTTTTRQPSAPAGPRPPARPKKKMRKNRKRISKAAMRAMLM
ncbi:Platelet-derived growth factor subunit B [Collichthys lucidus]|uniref:Platelet-derived growth factor subunit B n=1 Tax=Collichthys lucidus TaxID=240159 RepID=A0A4U5VW24_COLLU|nr:Platelet-derived growth factor subunit B [Collichthys lucidus]